MQRISLFTITVFLCQLLAAQSAKPAAGYLNIGYAKEKIKYEGGYKWDSEFGVGITVGRTFYLHKKPIANTIRIGLDWSYLDLNFAMYKDESTELDYYDDEEAYKLYKGEIGMQFGPSVTVSPVKGLNISAYFRYSPCYAAIYDDYLSDFDGGFASFFNTGLSVSYKFISLGVEQRWGDRKYKFEDEEDGDYAYSEKFKLKTSAPRFYIGFRF